MHLRQSTFARPGRLFAVGLGLAIFGCVMPGSAGAQQAPAAEENFNDPFENSNRAIFDFNTKVDHMVLVPVANAYRAVLPAPVQDSVHDFMRNLDEPVVFANDVLQARPDLAANTFARFVVNSTVGVAGLFDVATKIKLPYHSNDLGVTFAVWGFADGPYLMLPVLGPSNVRDTLGQIGDTYADPGNMVASNNHYIWATFARAATQGVDTRSRYIESLADIERTSLDYYATIRSLYRQRRAAEIRHEHTDVPNVTPVQGADSEIPPISYQVAPGFPPPEAPKK